MFHQFRPSNLNELKDRVMSEINNFRADELRRAVDNLLKRAGLPTAKWFLEFEEVFPFEFEVEFVPVKPPKFDIKKNFHTKKIIKKFLKWFLCENKLLKKILYPPLECDGEFEILFAVGCYPRRRRFN